MKVNILGGGKLLRDRPINSEICEPFHSIPRPTGIQPILKHRTEQTQAVEG
jgi:hypothetical protein